MVENTRRSRREFSIVFSVRKDGKTQGAYIALSIGCIEMKHSRRFISEHCA